MIFVSINTSVFSGNQAVIGPFGGGGALYSSGGVLNLGNNTFIGNAANGYGGAIAYSYECTSGNRLCMSFHTSVRCALQQSCVWCYLSDIHMYQQCQQCMLKDATMYCTNTYTLT